MSWLDKIQTQFIIKTGDSREWSPNWLNASRTVEYNVSEFDFTNTEGTLVKREKPRGMKYELELYFQGDDHLDNAEAFRISANDPRPWTITHPFYGSIIVQPLGLRFDNTKYNVTLVTGTIIETITEDSPKTSVDPIDKIAASKDDVDVKFVDSFVNDVKPETAEINKLAENNSQLYKEGSKLSQTKDEAQEYFNRFNTANTAILNATSQPLEAMISLQAMINYPGQFATGVKNRIDSLVNQFKLLTSAAFSILTRADKKIFEFSAGAIVSSMAYTASKPQSSDYTSRNDVIEIMDFIYSTHNDYITFLDTLQSDNGGSPDSYIPDADSQIALNELINFTISNLFNIALNAKQERTVFVEDDTNLIILAHRFYGLQADDSTIDTLIKTNNIGLNELLIIRKDRKIIYYV
jgi:prophage DNA circulation protein